MSTGNYKRKPRSLEHRNNLRLSHLGKHFSEETKLKISKASKGKKHSQERIEKNSQAQKESWKDGKRKGHLQTEETREKISIALKKEKSYKWIYDRTKLKVHRSQAYDQRYKDWMRRVKKRDNWKCRIKNNECSGNLEAHHILSWKDSPELRYEINNGISLCHAHHPRRRDDEIKLASVFQALVLTTA